MPSAPGPISVAMRSFISRAALLVKVTARICDGQARPVRQNMGDARGQHPRLAGAGAGEHQNRPVERLDRLALFGIERGEPVGRAARGGLRTRGQPAGARAGMDKIFVTEGERIGQFSGQPHRERKANRSPNVGPLCGHVESALL